jgi:Amt family ammonium transporter
LIHGGTNFFIKQLGATIGAAIWGFVFTYGMLWLIDKVTPVKVSEAEEDAGLDESLHGEIAYDDGVF